MMVSVHYCTCECFRALHNHHAKHGARLQRELVYVSGLFAHPLRADYICPIALIMFVSGATNMCSCGHLYPLAAAKQQLVMVSGMYVNTTQIALD